MEKSRPGVAKLQQSKDVPPAAAATAAAERSSRNKS
jgi:hypothetical protein